MVRIGLVGLGFMGYIHFLASKALAGARVAAVCSRDPKKLTGDWRSIRGNFGPPGSMVDLDGVAKYADYAELLADPSIDLVDLCNPTNQHPGYAIRAMEAGKHVLVEKAIALTLAEADEMLAVSKRTGTMLMVAHVLPFFPEFAFAAEAVAKGTYGSLLGGHLKRVIAEPDWSAAIGDADATGGPAVDLHIHDTHFLGLIAGVPQRVSSLGRLKGSAVTYLTTSYDYGPGGPVLTCSSGAIAMPSRPFVHGFELYFERATLAFDSGGLPLTVFPQSGEPEKPDLGDGEPIAAFSREIGAATAAVATGTMPPLLSAVLARDALHLCQLECESVKTGRPMACR